VVGERAVHADERLLVPLVDRVDRAAHFHVAHAQVARCHAYDAQQVPPSPTLGLAHPALGKVLADRGELVDAHQELIGLARREKERLSRDFFARNSPLRRHRHADPACCVGPKVVPTAAELGERSPPRQSPASPAVRNLSASSRQSVPVDFVGEIASPVRSATSSYHHHHSRFGQRPRSCIPRPGPSVPPNPSFVFQLCRSVLCRAIHFVRHIASIMCHAASRLCHGASLWLRWRVTQLDEILCGRRGHLS
jgi:hypothetical protein